MTLHATTTPSPVGELRIIASDRGIRAILWPVERPGRVELGEVVEVQPTDHQILADTVEQLEEYFAGERTAFDLPLDPAGTDFQRDVWAGLSAIPFGQTRSYGELADELEHPGAARAVGAATGRNPISIVVPCHRLVGSTGALTGFAGGLDAKRWLLTREGVLDPEPMALFGE